MMLAGERPRLRRSLPPSERNYSLGCLSRQLYPLSDSEATAGGAKGGRVPPLALNLVVFRSWPPLPALVFWAVAQLTSTGSVPGEKTRAEYVGTVQKEPEFVCRGGVRNVPLPPPPRPHGQALSSGGSWLGGRRGSRKGAPTGPGAHSLICPHLRPLRLLGARRTGGHEDPPARDRAPGRTAHALQSGPADAVVPGGAQRAAVISNCALATERLGRRGGAASRWLHRCTPGRGAAGQMSLRLV